MSIQFRDVQMQFSEGKRKDSVMRTSVFFDSHVRAADAAIKGFELGYTEGDHELKLAKVGVTDVEARGQEVTIEVTIGLRDDSGDYDDPYDGNVTVLVLADTTEGDGSGGD